MKERRKKQNGDEWTSYFKEEEKLHGARQSRIVYMPVRKAWQRQKNHTWTDSKTSALHNAGHLLQSTAIAGSNHLSVEATWRIVFNIRHRTTRISCYNIYPTRCNVTQFILSWNCSKCFGWYLHPSSGAQTTVSTASGVGHAVTAICRYRGRVGTGLSVLCVAYATHSTLKPVPAPPR